MGVLSAKNPTLMDVANATDPDGNTADVVELMSQTNEVLDDVAVLECNQGTKHEAAIRTGLPDATWRSLYQGVQPSKSTRAKITDSCGMLEAYAEIDAKLSELNGNSASFRLSEEKAFIEGMSQEMSETIFYGNEADNPSEYTGLAPRYNQLSGAGTSDNVIDAGGEGSTNGSIWLVVWSPETITTLYPKGSKAGLQHKDLGEQTIDAPDGSGLMQALRSHFSWDTGLHVKDHRYCARICNIDRNLLTKDASSGADLIDFMIDAEERIPHLGAGRAAWYVDRRIRSFLRKQITNKTINATITEERVAGKMVTMFNGVSVRRVDRLSVNEARVV